MRRILGLLLAVAIAGAACSSDGDGAPEAANTPPPDIEGLVAVPVLSANHTEDPVAYDLTPPAGGDHFPAWLNCGTYDVQPPDEVVVHALEHGAVWIAYQPSMADEDVATLVDAFGSRDKVMITPHADAPMAVALRAWGFALDLDDVTDPRIAEFVVAFEGADSAPEPGAPCRGALEIDDVIE